VVEYEKELMLRAVPEEGPKNDQRAGTPLPRGQAERAGAVQPREEKAPGRPYCGLSVLTGAYRKDGERLFTGACSDRTRADGFKLKEGRFSLDVRKKFFTLRVVRPWHRLLGEVVDAPSLEVVVVRLSGTLSNLVWWKVSLPVAGGWELDDL